MKDNRKNDIANDKINEMIFIGLCIKKSIVFRVI